MLNVTFWGFLAAATDFVIAQTANIVPLGSLFPFIAQAWPVISLSAIVGHAVSKGLRAWWQDRKDRKPLTAPVIEAVPAVLPINDVNPSRPQPPQPPPENLFQ